MQTITVNTTYLPQIEYVLKLLDSGARLLAPSSDALRTGVERCLPKACMYTERPRACDRSGRSRPLACSTDTTPPAQVTADDSDAELVDIGGATVEIGGTEEQQIEIEGLGSEFNIFVKTLTNKSVALTVREHEPVSSLMERIQDKVGIPSQAQSLVYNGRQLEWGRLLSTYSITADSNVYLAPLLSWPIVASRLLRSGLMVAG